MDKTKNYSLFIIHYSLLSLSLMEILFTETNIFLALLSKSQRIIMKKSLILLVFITLVLFSCKEKVTGYSPAFLGYWYGTNGNAKYILNIDLESHAVYKIDWPESNSVTIEGTARANTRRLNIDGKKYFDIVEYPHAIDTIADPYFIPTADSALFRAHYRMILNGLHKTSEDIPTGDFKFYK